MAALLRSLTWESCPVIVNTLDRPVPLPPRATAVRQPGAGGPRGASAEPVGTSREAGGPLPEPSLVSVVVAVVGTTVAGAVTGAVVTDVVVTGVVVTGAVVTGAVVTGAVEGVGAGRSAVVLVARWRAPEAAPATPDLALLRAASAEEAPGPVWPPGPPPRNVTTPRTIVVATAMTTNRAASWRVVGWLSDTGEPAHSKGQAEHRDGRRAQHWEEAKRRQEAPSSVHDPAAVDEGEADGRQCDGQADGERRDQRQAEAGAVEREGAQQHQNG